jgi:hypothetical protein
MKDAVSEKLKKKSVLKGLNERSNPNSPRKENASSDAAVETPTLWAAVRRLEMEELEGTVESVGSEAVGSALHSLHLDTAAGSDTVLQRDDPGDALPSAEEIVADMLRAAVQAAADSLSRPPTRS